MASSSEWPPKAGLSTINVPRESATVSSVGHCRIKAPAFEVFEAVRNVGAYSSWNSFVPRVTIQSQPDGVPKDLESLHLGSHFTFYTIMDANKPSKETSVQLIITDVSTPEEPSNYVSEELLEKDGSFASDMKNVYRICWKLEGGLVARGLQTERFHEILVVGPNECEVRTWENQGGVLARTVKWMYGKTLMEKFQMWCDDLKVYCEKDGKRDGQLETSD